MELTKTQKQILESDAKKIVIMSSAASGKTALLTEKVRRILQSNVDPREVAVITFTNMAASELIQRLGADYKEGIFIGTIHALANHMLRVGGVDTSKVLNDEKFDELFELIVKNPFCVKHLQWVLLDEAQDSDQLQFDFLFNMINPSHFFVVGDAKQSIYRWKGSDPQLILDLAEEPDVVTYQMLENFRNKIKILEYAKQLIRSTGLIDRSIPVNKELGLVEEVPYSADTIIKKLTERPDLKNWAILCRTNAEIQTVSIILKKKGIPFDTFRQGDLSKEELLSKMNQDTVKVLTVHSAKGLEWDNVMVIGARYYPEEERNVCYVAATRAKSYLVWMKYQKKKKVKVYNW